MLDAALKSQLAGYLERLVAPVEITAWVDDGPASAEMLELLGELTSLSGRITVRQAREGQALGGAPRLPSFALHRPGEQARIAFAGLPLGHEFTSLVLALLHVGGHPPKLDAETVRQIQALEGDHAFETYVSLSCQNCPDVVQALNLLAALNPRIRHTMIDGALFEQEVASRKILSVPSVYLNGASFGQGRMDLAQVLAKLDKGAASRATSQMNNTAPFDVLIVGGGPAGASAAIYAARKGIRVGVATERFGGQLLDTLGIENLVSVRETEGPKLAAALEQNVRAHDVQVMNLQRAQQLIPGRAGALAEVRFAGGASLLARSVVIATGARWREINVPGEKEYRNRGVAYCPHCDGPLFKGRDVAVIGGGNSGVEAAIDLAGLASHVTLIEYDAALRADAVLVNKLRSLPNIRIITSAQTTQVTGDGDRVTGLVYRDRTSGAIHALPLAGVFVQIGLVPNTDWLKDVIRLSKHGEIETDARGQTSVAGVFAAGDCTAVPFKQIVTAMGTGAAAALGAFDNLIRAPLAASPRAAVA